MMNKGVLFTTLVLAVFTVAILPSSCSSDQLPEPELEFCDSLGFNALTYDADIKSIIDSKCANLGCHPSGSPNGDYTSYSNMKGDLDNNKIFNRTIEIGDMPQIGSPELTSEEKDMLNCWLNAGYPEN